MLVNTASGLSVKFLAFDLTLIVFLTNLTYTLALPRTSSPSMFYKIICTLLILTWLSPSPSFHLYLSVNLKSPPFEEGQGGWWELEKFVNGKRKHSLAPFQMEQDRMLWPSGDACHWLAQVTGGHGWDFGHLRLGWDRCKGKREERSWRAFSWGEFRNNCEKFRKPIVFKVMRKLLCNQCDYREPISWVEIDYILGGVGKG